jgi:PPK2 family polyphosphate:nucleotide phosphotransferase
MASEGRCRVSKNTKRAKAEKDETEKDHAEKFWTRDPADLLRAQQGFQLSAIDTAGTPGFRGKKKTSAAALAAGAGILSQVQEMFYANSREGDPRKILLVLQAMDTAGKGGIVRHVVGSVDPQGIQYTSFKAPTKAELSHDFLWRIRKRAPANGMIGVFDRSHYEDVLIARVHSLVSADEIERRYEQINHFEQELADDNTTLIKVMLHISSAEQKARLAERLSRPDKYWKYNPGDVDERMLWDSYQEAYQIAIDRTSTRSAPWFVVPADHKWYARLAVQHLLIDALKRMNLTWPPATFDVETEQARLAAS